MKNLIALLVASAALVGLATPANAQYSRGYHGGGARVQQQLGADVGLERERQRLDAWNSRAQGPSQISLEEWRARQRQEAYQHQRGPHSSSQGRAGEFTGRGCEGRQRGVPYKCNSHTGMCVC